VVYSPRQPGRKELRIDREPPMQIEINVGEHNSVQREASVRIRAQELQAVHLHVAEPEKRNRTRLYLRRHALPEEKQDRTRSFIDPRRPLRSPCEPDKLPIAAHVKRMRESGMIPSPVFSAGSDLERFGLEVSMLAVPISDLVANLLRPFYHRDAFGPHHLFYFMDEPIGRREYWCAAFLQTVPGEGRLEILPMRFDVDRERALDRSGRDMADCGLIWAASLVPLVVGGNPLSAVEIASHDYDLRQVLDQDAERAIQYAYDGWYDKWDERVREIVQAHQNQGRGFAVYYHSILGVDRSKDIHVFQMEGRLPELAVALAKKGITDAGILDSGGSCALYDVWMGSYLNHGWYFREPRGSILVFELKSTQRIPEATEDSWFCRREV
jgi:hypothetical protein